MGGARARTTRRKTAADFADRYDLYQRSVQCVEAEIDFVDRVFRKLRGRTATRLREDFCGTGNTSCEWVRRRKGNIAVGLDIDPMPMAWGMRHNAAALNTEQRRRLELRKSDVLHGDRSGERFDVVLAMNFSYWCLKQRRVMLEYFQAVRRSLAAGGVFFLDFYGGPDALREIEERRRVAARPGGGYGSPGFTYVWDQKKYDPITGDILCYIHFRFKDGSEQKRAFRYDWRLWTIPELRDVLADAGFSRSTVYWEGEDGRGGGDGVFRPAKHGDACEAYVAYVVAEP